MTHAENLVTHPTMGNRNCQLVLLKIDSDMDCRLFFRHAFLHRRSTALAALRSGYRLNHHVRAAGKRHAVLPTFAVFSLATDAIAQQMINKSVGFGTITLSVMAVSCATAATCALA